MTVEEKAYNYASKVAKNRLTASEVAAHYGRGYIEGQEDMKHLAPFVCVSNKTWRPGSELPPVDENGNSQDVIVICGTMHLLCDLPRWSSVVGGVWGDKDVKWWCYPPKEN